jgi:hypothetical protein
LPIRSGRLKAAAVLALVPAAFLAVVFVLPDWRLWRHGVRIQGVVHSTKPTEHTSVLYGYDFRGQRYQYGAQGGAGFGNPPFDSLKTGTRIVLWVDPDHPEKALPGDPYPSLLNNLAFVVPVYFALIWLLYRQFAFLPEALRLGQD